MKAFPTLLRSILIIFLPICTFAQTDSLSIPLDEIINPDLVEDYVAGGEGEEGFDFNALQEELAYYRNHPLDLNKISRVELEGLNLLSDLQINDFLQYRQRCGNLIAIQELQAISSFSLNTIYRILPFVGVNQGLDNYKVSLGKMLSKGSNYIFLRWTRVLEASEGTLRSPEENSSYFLGNPNKFYLRYRHSYSNKMSYGFTAEKDAGEDFFKGSNPQGFDFYSAHFYLRNYNQVLKTIAIGDFTASFGQGLILYSGFGNRKGSMVMNIKRNRRTLMPYRSADESRFLRGVGLTLGFGKNLELTTFASSRLRDANVLIVPDSLVEELETPFLASSILGSGLHRSPSEVEDEKIIEQRTLGARIKYQTNQWHLALNGLYEDINLPLGRDADPYALYYFNGNQLANVSLDYSFLFRNYNFFGESAWSSNGGLATTNGLLLGLDRRLDLSILFRSFEPQYQALNPNPLAETRGARNEKGLYIGIEYRHQRHWKLAAYYDLYEHPWLRFQADAPSHGVDYRLRLTYFQKRKLETYVEFRNETKQINAPGNETRTNFLVDDQVLKVRFHLSQSLNKKLQLRSRLSVGFSQRGEGKRAKGIMFYQDAVWKFPEFPLAVSLRYAIFDTEDYAIRFYNYENDLLYLFSIPAYYNRGSRYYINLRYVGIRRMVIEARFAQTYWSNQDHFGSGLNRINGQRRSEVKAQISYVF